MAKATALERREACKRSEGASEMNETKRHSDSFAHTSLFLIFIILGD